MSCNWIPMRTDLLDDPAVIHLASVLGLDEFGAVGRLLKLWSWANEQLADGTANRVTTAWIDRFVSTPGFAAALIDSGWLQTRSGGVLFPKFDRWNSQGAKRRLMQTQAKQLQRLSSDGDKMATSPGHVSPSDGDKMATIGEKIREEVNPKPFSAPPASVPVPEPLPPERRGKTPKPPPKPREPDPLFDTIAAVSGLDPGTAGGLIGSVRATLAAADPPYTPDDVRVFAADFWRHCPYAARDGRKRPTPKEIEKNIGLVRAPPAPPQGDPPHGADAIRNRPAPPRGAAFRVEGAPGDFDNCAPSIVADQSARTDRPPG